MLKQGRPASRLDIIVRTLFLLIFLLWSPWLAAQFETLRFEHLTINDGLSQSSIQALAQDRRGYLWVGTQDGLNRYDGYRFDIMRNDPDNPRSLVNNNISSIFEDSSGILWVGTTGNTLHRYVRETDDFERYPIPTNATVFHDGPAVNVREIFETSDGTLWIGTDLQGLYTFDRINESFARARMAGASSINVLREANGSELWVGSATDLSRYEISHGELTPLSSDDELLLNEETRAIEVMQNGEVWAAGSAGLIYRYSANGTLLGRTSMRSSGAAHNDAIRSLLEDSNGQKWVGLIGGGVKVLSDSGEIIATLAHAPRDPYTLQSNTAYALFEDRAGVLWVGTLEAGLSKTPLKSGGFEHFRHVPGDPSSLSDNMVIEIAEDEVGGIWVGSSGGGLNYLPPDSSRFTNFRADPSNPLTLTSDRIWGLYLEPGGPLWVGTWGGGLNRFDRDTATVRHYVPDDSQGSIPGEIVTAVIGDGKGGIFVGLVDGGLVHLAAGSEDFTRVPLIDAAVEQENPINTSALYRDSRGRLWAGTWRRGICVSDAERREFRCHKRDRDDKRSINDDNIRAITEDEDGNIWIATGNGIARYDEESGTFDRYTSADGLSPGVVYGIVPEGDGVLWLSSNRGLMRFDWVRRSGRHYEYRDGLQANEFNGDAALKSRSGQIYFGGVGGITRFRPADLLDNPLPPAVVITEFSLFNKAVAFQRDDANSVLKQPISETRSLELDYDQNFIAFEFAGLHFVSPSRNRYAYRLEGLDLGWTETDARRRFASYANLAPGDYVFRVRAANSDGVWSLDDAAVNIHIAPPWWLTWWAKSLMLLIAVMLLLLYVQWRVSLLKKQTRQLAVEVEKRTAQIVSQRDTIERQAAHLEDALESKSRFFARLSHEFRTPITLILGPIDESLREAIPEAATRSLAIARRNGQRLLHLVDQLLTLARHGGKQHVERRPIALAPVARLVVAEFDSAIAQKGITLTLDADDELFVESNADALQSILINLVSNSLKYTESGGNISVSVARENGNAVLKVADTGVGIAEQHLDSVFNLFERGVAAGPGTGIGLTLVKELIDAHDGFIGVDSSPGVGTTVTVKLKALTAPDTGTPETLTELALDADIYAQGPTPIAAVPSRDDSLEILIIDDNDDMRHFIVELLKNDYRCVEARDGESGLAIAIEEIPDAVICDVLMLGIDGFEVLQRLRSNEHTSHVPIIMLTARGDEASRLRGLRARADDYIAKPFVPDELRYRLRNLLELSQLRAERARQHLLGNDARPSSAAEMPALTTRDQAFLKRLGDTLEVHYPDAEFHANNLAEAMHMSHRQLQRKLRALLDVVPATFLRDFRLQKAKVQLENGDSVTVTALDCGFSSPGYFAHCFTARYGARPSDVTTR